MHRKYLSFFLIFLLVLVCMGGALWNPGGILRLDYVATPFWDVNFLQNAWYLVPQIFVAIMGFEIGTKFVFFITLLSAGGLGILFARTLYQRFYADRSFVLETIAGTFLIMNPFAYERMMTQPVIYLAVILIGYALFFLLFSQNSKRYIGIGLLVGVAFDLSLHVAYMIVLMFFLYFLFFYKNITKKDIVGTVVAGGLALMINLHWILAPVFGTNNIVSSVENFDFANLEAFKTHAIAPLDVWGTNALLYGFWGERHGNHQFTLEFLSKFWYVAGFLFLVFGIVGFMEGFKKGGNFRKLVLYVAFFGTISLVFGIGIASDMLVPMTEWMIEHVPLWQGYREPQKWIGMLIFAEMMLVLIGIGFFLRKYKNSLLKKSAVVVIVSILLYLWSPGVLLGYQGQLKNTVYPEEFVLLRESLLKEGNAAKTVAFPWHAYLACSWTNGLTVSNPIGGLLAGTDVVGADNIEIGKTLYSNSTNETSKKIEQFLKTRNISDIDDMGISGIVLMKRCADASRYTWIDSLRDCRIIEDNTVLSYYQCNIRRR